MGVSFEYGDVKLVTSLKGNLDRLKAYTSNSCDLIVTEVTLNSIPCALVTTDGMVSTQTITNLVLVPLSNLNFGSVTPSQLVDSISNKKLLSTEVKRVVDFGTLLRASNSGFAILLVDGCDTSLAFGVQGYNVRSISEPSSEQNVMGSHEGFVEAIRVSMSLVRRRMKSPSLVFEMLTKGSKSYTDVCLCYMADRVSPELLQGVRESLAKLDVESILLTGDVQPYLESPKPRIFDSVGYTERPDVLCSKLLEGRIGVLIDGTPYVLVVPKLFTDSFQTLDDYTGKPFHATFVRWLKYLAFILATTLPAIYVAVCTHDPQLLNRELLTILATAERNAPFSILVECFTVLVVYEVIKEAGVRLPKPIGGAVSIVAGLIIGDCAVSSGYISNPLLVVSAVAVVCGFTVPDLARQISVLRLVYLLVGGVFGLFGVGLVSMVVIVNACATQDYGYVYTYPISPFSKFAMRDVLTRVSSRKMKKHQFKINR
jgi:spore germination protein KA